MKENVLAELDLAIPDMLVEADEIKASDILRHLPGVDAVRVVQRGAWVNYRPDVISKDEICHALRSAGLRAGVFQDSLSGQTGHYTA